LLYIALRGPVAEAKTVRSKVAGGEARPICPRRLVVVGGGYVGLHTAVLAVLRGVKEVLVIDIDKRVVDAINSRDSGRLHVRDWYVLKHWGRVADSIRASSDYEEARGFSHFIVAVQTPLRGARVDYTPLRSVAASLAPILEPGSLVVSETTIYPGGTWDNLVKPILEARPDLEPDSGLLAAHAPERLNPGSRQWPPERIPRVVGGIGPKSLEAALRLYRDCFRLEVHPVADIRVAEASKLLENSFRLLNIVFFSELKKLFDQKGVDFREVVKAASTKPFGFMPFWPGPYAGGPCLPKDTVMMAEYTGSTLLQLALRLNEDLPLYYAARLLSRLRVLNPNARRVLFYGVGYKPEAYTDIESPPRKVAEWLKRLDPLLEIRFYDPKIPHSFVDEAEALAWAEVVVRWGYRSRELGGKPVIQLEEV